MNCDVDYGLDEGDAHRVRCKPENIDELSRVTKFTRKELQTIYRGFKQVVILIAILSTTLSRSYTPSVLQSFFDL